jgi:hypothetical protein
VRILAGHAMGLRERQSEPTSGLVSLWRGSLRLRLALACDSKVCLRANWRALASDRLWSAFCRTRAGFSGPLGSSDLSQTGHSFRRAGPQRLTAALGSVVVLFALMTNGQHLCFPPWKDFVKGYMACGIKACD